RSRAGHLRRSAKEPGHHHSDGDPRSRRRFTRGSSDPDTRRPRRRARSPPVMTEYGLSASHDQANTTTQPSLAGATPLSAAPSALIAVLVRCNDCWRAVLVAAGVAGSLSAADTGVIALPAVRFTHVGVYDTPLALNTPVPVSVTSTSTITPSCVAAGRPAAASEA